MFEFLYNYTFPHDYSYINEFAADVFPAVGIVSLLVSLAICLLYYVVINRITDKLDQVWHWAVFLLLTAAFGGIFAFLSAQSYLINIQNADVIIIPLLFWVMNALYCLVYFFVFSILLKKASKYATKVPF